MPAFLQHDSRVLAATIQNTSAAPTLTSSPSTTASPTTVKPTPTPAPKAFDETVTLQFFVEKDYAVTVKGVIELVNNSGKDISLTQYSMDLPYFTLKKTEIGYVYPPAFLVDMYSENNSILFTFKSMYTKPVVIGKNGKITFTFTAQIVNPYKDIGPLRSLSFPFSLGDAHRKTNMTIVLDQTLPLISAPKTSPELAQKGIYTISENSGKGFLFIVNKNPLAITLSGMQEVTLPLASNPMSCMDIRPISCVGCKEIRAGTQQVMAVKGSGSTKISTTFAKTFDAVCLFDEYKNTSVISSLNMTKRQKIAGYAIAPDSLSLIPATWEYIGTSKGTYVQLLDTSNVVYPYQSDFYGALLIPMITCNNDDECLKATQTLRNYNSTITDNQLQPENSYVEAQNNDIKLAITQKGASFVLTIENLTDKFLLISNPRFENNQLFELRDTIPQIIAPKSTINYSLFSPKKIQTSNQPATIKFLSDKITTAISFTPVRITILAIIELLGYLFIVSLGVCMLSVAGIILYNRVNGKTKT